MFEKLKIKQLALFFLIISSMYSCIPTSNTIKNRNLSYIYNPGSSNLHPLYSVYHKSDTITVLMVNVFPSELLFSKANDKNKLQAKLKLKYKLYPSIENNNILDSSSTVYNIDKIKAKNSFQIYQTIKTPSKGNYTLEVITSDLIRNSTARTFISLEKSRIDSRQNFSAYAINNSYYFKNYFRTDEIYRVFHNSQKPENIFVTYFSNAFPLPPPPFSASQPSKLRLKPDSVVSYKYQPNLYFIHNEPSIYYFQIDTASMYGFPTYHHHKYFPWLRTTEQLIRPLKYLTSTKEFKSIRDASIQKVAIDNYWLKIAGNVGRAKELIRIYYNRVQFANVYFTSHTEGWRTDRGMIYVIFGPPKTIYKTDNYEKWIYGDGKSLKPIIFNFTKIKNPFSDNFFVLKRNPQYKNTWYKAVDTWRQGKVFYID